MTRRPTDMPAAETARTTLASRAMLQAFLETTPDFVHFKDGAGRFIAVSQSKLKRNGLSKVEDILGKTDFDFFAAKNAQRSLDDENEVMRTGVPMVSKLEQVHWADGRETWSLINKMPLRDRTGQIIGTFGITRDVTRSKLLESTLEKKHKELMDTSRVAGKAEVATGVLHNVGNVLNSLNVSASVIATGFRQSKTDSLAKLTQLLREHGGDLGTYLSTDPKGRKIPDFIASLALHFASERDRLLHEIDALQKNVDHIKEIVSMQQSYAVMVGTVETLDAATMMEDAIRMTSTALIRNEINVVRHFIPAPPIIAEKGKVLQILVNLIRNGKYACDESGRPDKVMTLHVVPGAPGHVRLIVEDNGIGIAPENLEKVFRHGFTTKATGHGFGVHSSAIAAKEMKGSLTAQSAGLGHGAIFTLELPVAGQPTSP